MTSKTQAQDRLRTEMLASEAAVPTSGLGRLWQTGRSALGIGSLLAKARRGDDLDLEAVQAIVQRLAGLKGVGMKLGQMLGYVDQSVPEELRGLFSLLQTSAPGTGFDAVTAVLREALGERAEVLIAGLERTPVAVASIGQVHRARLPDGAAVAVKVRHPGVEQALVADFRTASVGKMFAAIAGAASITGMIEEARTAFLEECDFPLEARRQRHFARLFADDPVIIVPSVATEWSAEGVLVTRWTPGRSLDEFLASGPDQRRRDLVGAALFRFWMRTLYRDGLFHGDPHPGNFAIQDDDRVIIYDFGCVRSFEPALRRGFAGLAAATRDDDPEAIVAAITALGGMAPRDPKSRAHLRELLRSFFGPLLTPGARRIASDEGLGARNLLRDKRAIIGLQLPARLLFLFRLRFGLYAVLSRLQAEVDWAGLESQWARES
ncbi:MAG: AarF/ABC1/UbiB kinase family protein [Nannocystis sp.]|nr:AarF/ABC1/UbiB kinase family protein [Nannocystis sp.]MBA3547748.1 AarF/ABC1/UbiB kinase family protein [Nannocystis sp.]